VAGVRQQGAGAGSAYVVGAFLVSGVLTYAFQSLSARTLGPVEYGGLAILWSATFLTVQVLWIGTTQALSRHIAEREARGQGWRPVVSSVRRLQAGILAAFLLGLLLLSPVLASRIFGDWWLLAAFALAVAAYAPEYYRRGTFSGRRHFARLGALHVTESLSRLLVAAGLLFAGAGVFGPALAIILGPLVGVLAVRSAPASGLEEPGEAFSSAHALRFAGPVILCVACAQAFLNGGPVLVSAFGGGREEAGLLLAALILTRIPQYVLSPTVVALLPHASRRLAEDPAGFDRFVARALGVIVAVGVGMVAGAWLFGELGMRLFYGPGFEADRGLLAVLAALAALCLLGETMNQALFARGLERFAAAAWLAGVPVALLSALVLDLGVVEQVSYSLVLGVCAVLVVQAALYLRTRKRPGV
jgi:O-antigen/teichoic acid export membrane protein